MGYPLGMIHGRFQPFHLEHLRYFRLAWERSERIIVNITNPDPSTVVQDERNDHRHLSSSNPFSFTERLIMIQESLREEGYPLERIFTVPLPIHHPDRWPYYVPPGTAIFVVVYSPWERQKAERFQQAGFNVILEDSLIKRISGQEIRRLMATGGHWQHLVPPAVAHFLDNRADACPTPRKVVSPPCDKQGPGSWR
jgi:nicotinamide mononucleotide adenylyltransferase